jgi:hypothetical protein
MSKLDGFSLSKSHLMCTFIIHHHILPKAFTQKGHFSSALIKIQGQNGPTFKILGILAWGFLQQFLNIICDLFEPNLDRK